MAEPLPADTRRALSSIVQQLRNVPRTIVGDPAEVVHFLGRTARALERLRDTPVPVSKPAGSVPVPVLLGPAAQPVAPRALSARERAEAVFRGPAVAPAPTSPSDLAAATFPSAPIVLPAPRTITDRRGRGVRVEVRRARAAGQLEMPV